jgi:hypothetical protein
MTACGGPSEPVLRRNDAVIWDRVDGATLLCHTGRVEFFKLNDTGALIWGLCDGRTAGEIVEALCRHYPDANRELIQGFVLDYLSALDKEGLLAAPN